MTENNHLPMFSGLSFAYFTETVDEEIKELWVKNGGSVAYGITTNDSLGNSSIDLYIQDCNGHKLELSWADQLDWKDVLVFANEGDVGLEKRDDMTLGFPFKHPDSQLIIFSSDWICRCIEEGQIIPLRDWIVHANANLDVDFLEAIHPPRYTVIRPSKIIPVEGSSRIISDNGTIDSPSFTRPCVRSGCARSGSSPHPATIQATLQKHLMRKEVEREKVEKKNVEELLVVDDDGEEEDWETIRVKADDSVMITPTTIKPALYSFVENDLSALLHLDITTIVASGSGGGDYEHTAFGITGLEDSRATGLTEDIDDQDIENADILQKPTTMTDPPIEWYAYKSSKVIGGKFQFLMGGEGVGVFDLDGWTKGGMWCVEEISTKSVPHREEPQEKSRSETPQSQRANKCKVNRWMATQKVGGEESHRKKSRQA